MSSWSSPHGPQPFVVKYPFDAPPAGPAWAIFDDFFPNLLTGFRIAEFNAYLRRFPRLKIFSALPDFPRCLAEYARLYPDLASRIAPFHPTQAAGIRFAYLNFLNNAFQFLPVLEHFRIPFVLTLYPGGGFGLAEPESDAKLSRVCASPMLAHVIVTQRCTAEYLTTRFPATKQTMIFGCVVNPLYFAEPQAERRWFGRGKETFDICFVGEKYMPHARNKGFPEFIDAAIRIAGELPEARFHVVGSCGPDDWPLRSLAGRVRFHGRLATQELSGFFRGMDAIASPNRPFTLHSGNFDGFPTASCVEASLSGVAMVVTDELGLSAGYYRPDSELVTIKPQVQDVVDALIALARSPDRLYAIASAGQARSRVLYAPETQIEPRLAAIVREATERGVTL